MSQIASERAMVAASQLEKIEFVDFTVDLVKGVYETVVKAAMDQLRSYADLVGEVSKDLIVYQAGMIGADGSTEIAAKVDSYVKDVLELDPASTSDYAITSEKGEALKGHFIGITCPDASTPPIDKGLADFLTADSGTGYTLKVEDLKAFVTRKLKAGVKQSQDLLKTILKIGMEKVVITNGEIRTKLTFHVDAQDIYAKESRTSDEKVKNWSGGGSLSGGLGMIGKILSGGLGGSLTGGASSRRISVSVVNEKSSSATNMQVDILGEVRIMFRTETFPSVDA